MSFGHDHLAARLPALLDRHSGLTVELILNDCIVDLVEEGYDIALRIADLADSTLIARRLAPVRRVVAAAPSYLDRRGTPQVPRDLVDHSCLGYSYSAGGNEWRLRGPDGVHRHRFRPSVVANNGSALAAMAAAGAVVVQMPTFILERYLRSGTLVAVLAENEPPPLGLYAVYPPGRPLAAKVRAFIDFAAATFTDPPYWDAP